MIIPHARFPASHQFWVQGQKRHYCCIFPIFYCLISDFHPPAISQGRQLAVGPLPPLFRSGGPPARRRAGASRPAEITLAHTNRAGTLQNRAGLPSLFPGGGTRTLYGRRDVRRYARFAQFSSLAVSNASACFRAASLCPPNIGEFSGSEGTA